ncbi:MAG: transcription termination factor NusA, partial [Clostridia bacterium]|nr:transcription termination factor NusA [Clostridia bacterium]
MNKEFFLALDELEREYRIPKDSMIESIEAGLVSAYKKEFGVASQISVRLNEEKMTYKVYAHKLVVEEVEDDDSQIDVEDAQYINPKYKVGDVYIEDVTPKDFSRIAAQTAKQVILQRINDIKKEMVLSEMSQRQGEILSAVVRRKEGNTVYVEITGTQMEGVMMQSDQVPNETYNVGDIIKVYVKKIRESLRGGTQVIVSRSSAGFVRRLFELEVPEIKAGLVKIVSIVREAGFRTKMAVKSEDPNVDAIGSCIGNKGVRVNAIIAELGGYEKIDVVEYCDDSIEYIARALSPAQVLLVSINEEEKNARVIVPDEKLSLAIGRNGQNARLAAKLTGWKVDVK